MEKLHEFKESLKLGDKGEAIVIGYLNNHEQYAEILDVSGNIQYQDIDVDIILKHVSGKTFLGEIKTDSYKTGNIFYEDVSATEVNSKGCMEKTQADFLFYYYIALDELYIIDMPKYREWFINLKPFFDKQGFKKSLKNKRYNGSTYSTIGYAIPLVYLSDKQWVKKIEGIREENN